MNPPKIFISATSGDLSSARQIAKEALLTINCHPVEQTNFEPDWRSVTDMLRGKISDCQALIHLVGFRYGAEPNPATLPGGTPRRSYTQMEYRLARELGLRVYTFLLPETYPFDVPENDKPIRADTPEQTQLQAAHRALIQSSPHLYEKPANDLDLRTRIIALREQVISLEQEQQSIAKEVKITRHWGLWAAAGILLILAGIGIWLNVISQKQSEQTNMLKDQSTLLREAVVQLEQLTDEKARLGIKITDLPREAVETELAARVGISVVELRLNIEAGKKSLDALTRAHANLLAGKLADAHAAAKEVRDAETPAMQRVIQSLQVDGQAYVQEVKYEAALESYQKAAALVDKIADPFAWACAQNNVTIIQVHLARYGQAEPLMKEIVSVLEHLNRPELAKALNNLAQLLQATNRLAEAEPLMQRALQIDEANFGPNHPKIAIAVNNLGVLLYTSNRMTEAEPLMQRALKIDEANLGSNHPNVARDLGNLAQLLRDTNRLTEAEPLMRRALKISENSFGPDHPDVAIHLNNLALLLQATNRLTEAELLMRRALKIDEVCHPPDHPSIAVTQNSLATLFFITNRLTEAEPLCLRVLGTFLRFQARNGQRHPNIVKAVENYLLLAREMKVSDTNIHGRLDKLRQESGLESAAFEAIWQEVLAVHSAGPFLVTITEMIKGGQGEALGLQAGDIYISYNGQAITSMQQFVRLTGESKREAISLEVLRGGKKLTFTAKPGKFGTMIENRPLPSATGTAPAK